MQPRNNKAEEFPAKVEELLGYVLRHVASELGVDECPAPLEESLRIYTRAVQAACRDQHEHTTPLVHVDADHSGDVNEMVTRSPSVIARSTLPTEPPVSYEDPPQTGRTSRGFPRAG